MLRVSGCCECLDAASVWMLRVSGCCECLDAASVWMLRVSGCCECLVCFKCAAKAGGTFNLIVTAAALGGS